MHLQRNITRTNKHKLQVTILGARIQPMSANMLCDEQCTSGNNLFTAKQEEE
jgi:hypothetical protein